MVDTLRRVAGGLALLVLAGAAGSACSAHTSTSASASTPPPPHPRGGTVVAEREPLTTAASSPVAHDNEVMALASHDGRLFAATDQWMYGGPSASGQVLVKNSSAEPWHLFEQTQSVRVQALDSFPIPRDQGVGAGHAVLVTQAIVDGRSRIQWLVDGASSFATNDSFLLASNGVDVRSFGAHEDRGTWAVYAGANPTGILRGTWSPSAHTLVFDPKPELVAAPPGSPGLKTQKVTGFADCGGALYASINTKLYRRNDGDLPRGAGRWVLVYQAPPVGPRNSGLRGLSCVTHAGAPSLLASTEGNGDIFRFDNLPRGQLDAPASAGPGHGVDGLVPVLEFAPKPAIAAMLARAGTDVPATGKGSLAYVIAAYNNFETLRIDGVDRQLFGFEWGYLGDTCPSTRACGPTASGVVSFDATACFAIRTDSGTASYDLRCLGGPSVRPTGRTAPPIRSGQAFVSTRTIAPTPFHDGQLYLGGYDCNFYPADGTAWVATARLAALHPTASGHQGKDT